MAYNHGREERKWRIWKEAEETVLRKYGVDESTIEEIRTYDRAEFNSNRRFYRWTSDFGEYLEGMAAVEPFVDVKTVADLLDEIENENLYRALLTVDKRTLQIVLLKMQGYSTKEISSILNLSIKSIYKRMERLRNKLKQFKG
ncbi:MAG: sigma-70 family RNA polymerase sigma factor [Clostridiales bacterium]|jgi:RNA polymerase sigma factor (sigma-70 family)|nr:sigma-70 family RNA polymerase sigma factor [Clostridiales bacterium]MCI8771730.1 sigma-70 family RNA polymerase sigma factor [Lachnospiraceae bacterium]